MFVDTTTALRIEQAEAKLTRAVTEAVLASGRAPKAVLRTLGGGVASYLRPESPMNKLIGLGFDTPIEPAALADIEQEWRARGELVRVELSTLARFESSDWLSTRGYRLIGFENVLVRRLTATVVPVARTPHIRIERVDAATRATWQQATVNAITCPDETGLVVDNLSRRLVEEVIEDVLEDHCFDRYLASVDGTLAGAASMRVVDGIALLSGSATLPAQRRRGVQAALIVARLDEACLRGADLAVITTAPGSQSQANVMKQGFSLAYARAILVFG